MGIAELVKIRAKELYKLNDRINTEINTLTTQLSGYTKPAIVTEGKYDVKILETAWDKLYPNTTRYFQIFSCNVVSSHIEEAGVTVLKPYLETILPSEYSVKIGIFDQDAAGKEHYNNLLHFEKEENGYRRHHNKKAYAMLLPNPPSDENLWDTRERCIEFLFSKEYLTDSYVTHEYSKKNGGKYTAEQANFLLTRGDLFADDIVHRVKLIPTKKRGFAETKVPTFPKEAFINFKPLFEKVLSILA